MQIKIEKNLFNERILLNYKNDSVAYTYRLIERYILIES